MIKVDINHPNISAKFEIKNGEFLTIIGDSGSGKTTLLRVLAGLESAKGTIEVDNLFWLNNKHSLPPQKRSIGFVMQDYALFENMRVIDNLLYVNSDINLADRLLKIVELTNFKDRYPKNLSGGQKQRVALIRSIMLKPKLLLLDEPLSALHSTLRETLQNSILKLHKEFDLTTVMVTHNPQEIYKMADRVIKIERGKITDIKTLNKKHSLPKALLLDKVSNNKTYQLIVDIKGSQYTINTSKDKFNQYKIGELLELKI